jgi:hypothetical protein
MTMTLELTTAEATALEWVAGHTLELGEDELLALCSNDPAQVRDAFRAFAKLSRAVVENKPPQHDPDRRWVM